MPARISAPAIAAGKITVRMPAKLAVSKAGKGGCGTGAGGFKAGNTCGGKAGSHADTKPENLKSSSPEVVAIHRKLAKAEISSSERLGQYAADVHLFYKKAKSHEKLVDRPTYAQEVKDANTLTTYRPSAGNVAIGLRPAKPSVEQAKTVTKLKNRLKKGEKLTDDEHASIVDRDVSHYYEKLDPHANESVGHSYLLHDRSNGKNHFATDAEFQSMKENQRVSYRQNGEKPSFFTPIRQFNSHGVEVPVDLKRFDRTLHPDLGVDRIEHYRQGVREHTAEQAAAKGVPRAEFGTNKPTKKRV